jgi:hypothetical protein
LNASGVDGRAEDKGAEKDWALLDMMEADDPWVIGALAVGCVVCRTSVEDGSRR